MLYNHFSSSSSISLPLQLSFEISLLPLLLLSLFLFTVSLLAVCHGWSLSTGVLWQKLAQRGYFSWRCHCRCALWERGQSLFSIIRSVTSDNSKALLPLHPSQHASGSPESGGLRYGSNQCKGKKWWSKSRFPRFSLSNHARTSWFFIRWTSDCKWDEAERDTKNKSKLKMAVREHMQL